MGVANTEKTILVTGGAGFIGSNFVLNWLNHATDTVVNIDLLTYAGNIKNLDSLSKNPAHVFVQGDIADKKLLSHLLATYKPYAVVNFAAESHVDRSILNPDQFIHTNVVGVYHLLEATRDYWEGLTSPEKAAFRFLHVSTDEVYGSLEKHDPAFTEHSQYQPNSPYSASKAASDHLVRAWYHTYDFPVLTTNCSNNYGPYQFPEKLIPLVITNALAGKPLPIYGDGQNIRDWLFVTDHCSAIRTVLAKGKPGECYNIGGNNEKTNLEVVETICTLLDEYAPLSKTHLTHPVTKKNLLSYRDLITFVKDRQGHDRRYAIDSTKIQKELGWRPNESFETGLEKTVRWYLDNTLWVQELRQEALQV